MELYDNPEKIEFTTPLPQVTDFITNMDSSILDLGCGYGRVLKHCYDLGFRRITGIDISSKLIERAKRICPQGQFFQGDIKKLNGVGKFDLVLLCGVIEYLIEDTDREALVYEISKHLTSHGKVLLESFIIDDNEKIYKKSEKQGYSYGTIVLSSGLTLKHSTVDGIDSLFEKFGFRKLDSKKTEYLTWVGASTPGYTSLWELG